MKRILFFLGVISCFFACSSESKPIENDNANDNIANTCCAASSTIIFWRGDSLNLESDIKSILSELNIEFEDLSNQEFDAKTSTIDGIRDIELSRLSSQSNSWSSLNLRLNSTLTDKICQKLSSKSKSPVIAFLEYDESAWGYCLFQDGKLIDTFWNDHVTVEQPKIECTANIDILASMFKVAKSDVQPYLMDISGKENLGKINANDEFELEDPWVRVDFMKQLGLIYPENGKWIYIIE
jgi:hypothetical protein